MRGQSEAINKRPPHAAGALDTDGSPDLMAIETAVAFGVASTAATAVLANGIPIGGCFITLTVDSDCYIIWGPTAALTPAASAANAWPHAPGIEYEYRINEKDAFFRVIRKTADGVLKLRRSNL